MTYQDKKRLKAILEFRDPECKRDLLESLLFAGLDGKIKSNIDPYELIVYDRWGEKEIMPLYDFLSSVFDELLREFEELKEG